MIRICMIGTGYVGLVTGTCLAETGNDVACVDCDREKIDLLKQGEIPIYEPGLAELVGRNAASGRLRFTTDLAGAAESAQLVFLAVGIGAAFATRAIERTARLPGLNLAQLDARRVLRVSEAEGHPPPIG